MIIKNITELKKFAQHFLEKNTANLILLEGDLGSGKTTFVQQIGAILKIKEKINSPTFVISKKYEIWKETRTLSKGTALKHNFKNLIHIDAYRLSSKNDLKNIGLLDDLKNSDNLIFIEWGNLIEKFIPLEYKKNIQKINFEYLDKNKREIKF